MFTRRERRRSVRERTLSVLWKHDQSRILYAKIILIVLYRDK